MPSPTLPEQLVWLADAPLFIDSDMVYQFYDAVARPAAEVVKTVNTLDEEHKKKIAAKLKAEIKVEPGALAALLAPVFSFLKPTVSLGGEAGGEREWGSGQSRTTESMAIRTPQRKLVDLAIHYLIEQTDRLFLVDDVSEASWRDAASISKTPRALAFLNLQAGVKLIPTAAEFATGGVELIYSKLDFGDPLPDYPEKGDNLQEQRKQYWTWFDTRFSATKAMVAVENIAKENGPLKWIDYRLPVDGNGSTLHLHICPRSQYDVGVFAYNFIKRAFKHGIRLVGTLKSEPDMNVLAVYEK